MSAKNSYSNMTAQEATTFNKHSESNVAILQNALVSRKAAGLHSGCKCLPYSDIFTYERWKAQGRFVRKGEKTLAAIPTVREVTGKDGQPKKIAWKAYVFCRCQTDATGEKVAAPITTPDIQEGNAYAEAERKAEEKAFLSDPDFIASVSAGDDRLSALEI